MTRYWVSLSFLFVRGTVVFCKGFHTVLRLNFYFYWLSSRNEVKTGDCVWTIICVERTETTTDLFDKLNPLGRFYTECPFENKRFSFREGHEGQPFAGEVDELLSRSERGNPNGRWWIHKKVHLRPVQPSIEKFVRTRCYWCIRVWNVWGCPGSMGKGEVGGDSWVGPVDRVERTGFGRVVPRFSWGPY